MYIQSSSITSERDRNNYAFMKKISLKWKQNQQLTGYANITYERPLRLINSLTGWSHSHKSLLKGYRQCCFSGCESSFSKFANPQHYIFHKYSNKVLLPYVHLITTYRTDLLVNHFTITWNFIKVYFPILFTIFSWNKEMVCLHISVALYVVNLILFPFLATASYIQLILFWYKSLQFLVQSQIAF